MRTLRPLGVAAGAGAGAVLVLVLGCGGGRPEITGVQPALAAPGDEIAIAGTGLGALRSGDGVRYGDRSLEIVSWTDVEVRARLPADIADGDDRLTVTTGARSSNPLTLRVAGPLAVFGPELTPSPDCPLAGLLTFRLSRPAALGLAIELPDERIDVPRHAIRETGPLAYEALVLELVSGSPATLAITLSDGGETTTDRSVTHVAGPLPSDLELPTEIRAADPSQMEPGYTLFGLTATPRPTSTDTIGHAIAVDAAGRVRWYASPDLFAISQVKRSAAGTVLAIEEGLGRIGSILEIDMLGREIHRWRHPGPDTFHHDVVELPNGNLLTLATEMREIAGYPAGTGNVTWNVVGDQVVEITREGEIVGTLSLFDVLDPYRYVATPDFHLGLWNQIYGVSTKDWTHVNGLAYDPSDDSVVLSIRHQSVLAKIRRDPAELVWVIGEDLPDVAGDDGWPWLERVGPGLPPSMPHNVELLPDGAVITYDNGNARAEGGSQGVIYAPDVATGTYIQRFRWTDPDYDPPLYSSFTGDARVLPGGTVLVADTGMSTRFVPLLGKRWVRYAEVREADAAKLWELWIEDPGALRSFTGYGAERVPSLYPPPPSANE